MLEKVHFDEAKQSQLPALELLIALGYKYISRDEALAMRGDDSRKFILRDIAAKKLMEINDYHVDGQSFKFSTKDIADAIEELESIPYEGLMDTAQKIYNIIMPTSGGKTIKVFTNGKISSENFRFIDFEHPHNNDFRVTTEYVATGKQTIRPDIVCFVNGIPFAVIENKKSSVPVTDATQQNYRNQTAEYCPKLYTYTQLLVGTNGKELLYATTGTPSKFYASWKEKDVPFAEIDQKVQKLIASPIDQKTYAQILTDLNGYTYGHQQVTQRLPTEQDRGIALLFEPARLLDLTKNYILFDAGDKKMSRYQQFFAIHKMLNRIAEIETTTAGITRRKGGLVWHTQGSGKSLTMVMFIKALIENPHITNPRVIIVTDRRDLDRQIRDTFKNCNLKKEVTQATSGQNLLDLIQSKSLDVITTVVDKFESAARKNAGFVDKDQNIFVLIDEAHRSQNGIANFEMTKIIPHACYIGFTGTPLMKKEKESWKKFGGYIDKYTIDDALQDKIILPLIYEGRYVDLDQNAGQIDKHLERFTADLNYKQKSELQRYIDKSVIKDNPQRITEIGYDVSKHYMKHFQHSGLKAQLVAPSKFSAIILQKFFQDQGKIQTAVVISDEHDDGDESDTHKSSVLDYLNKLRERQGNLAKYEQDIINSFKNNADGIEIIIVVDKLLTGFDAPRNTVLYLAKDLKDHNLLQAIARVNRLYDNEKKPKTSGFIIDYSENAKNIQNAMMLFGNFDEEDVRGTLTDVHAKIKDLEESYSHVHDIFKQIKGSTDDEAYLQHLQDDLIREEFYKSLNKFIRTFSECYVLQDFVHEFKNIDMYTWDLKKFIELRKTASLKYADRVNLKEYRQSLVNILDKYVDARGVEILTTEINITDKEKFAQAVAGMASFQSKAYTIASQVQKTISERADTDPEFYMKFSKRISDIISQMREGKLSDIAALQNLTEIKDEVLDKKDETLPENIRKVRGADIYYRNFKSSFEKLHLTPELYEQVVLSLFEIVKHEAIVDWYKNVDVKRHMMNKLDDYLYDIVVQKYNIPLTAEHMKAIIEEALFLAENNHEIFR